MVGTLGFGQWADQWEALTEPIVIGWSLSFCEATESLIKMVTIRLLSNRGTARAEEPWVTASFRDALGHERWFGPCNVFVLHMILSSLMDTYGYLFSHDRPSV